MSKVYRDKATQAEQVLKGDLLKPSVPVRVTGSMSNLLPAQYFVGKGAVKNPKLIADMESDSVTGTQGLLSTNLSAIKIIKDTSSADVGLTSTSINTANLLSDIVTVELVTAIYTHYYDGTLYGGGAYDTSKYTAGIELLVSEMSTAATNKGHKLTREMSKHAVTITELVKAAAATGSPLYNKPAGEVYDRLMDYINAVAQAVLVSSNIGILIDDGFMGSMKNGQQNNTGVTSKLADPAFINRLKALKDRLDTALVGQYYHKGLTEAYLDFGRISLMPNQNGAFRLVLPNLKFLDTSLITGSEFLRYATITGSGLDTALSNLTTAVGNICANLNAGSATTIRVGLAGYSGLPRNPKADPSLVINGKLLTSMSALSRRNAFISAAGGASSNTLGGFTGGAVTTGWYHHLSGLQQYVTAGNSRLKVPSTYKAGSVRWAMSHMLRLTLPYPYYPATQAGSREVKETAVIPYPVSTNKGLRLNSMFDKVGTGLTTALTYADTDVLSATDQFNAVPNFTNSGGMAALGEYCSVVVNMRMYYHVGNRLGYNQLKYDATFGGLVGNLPYEGVININPDFNANTPLLTRASEWMAVSHQVADWVANACGVGPILVGVQLNNASSITFSAAVTSAMWLADDLSNGRNAYGVLSNYFEDMLDTGSNYLESKDFTNGWFNTMLLRNM